MRRRTLLASLAGGSAALGGCSTLTSSGDEPTGPAAPDSPTPETPVNDLPMTETLNVEPSGPVPPGEDGVVAITVAGATNLNFTSVPGGVGDEEAPVRFEFDRPAARFDPVPDLVFQSFPPGWQ